MSGENPALPHVAVVVGTRPNFVKAAPLLRAIEGSSVAEVALIDAAQHYDANLSAAIYRDVGLRAADVTLDPAPAHTGEARLARQEERLARVFNEVDPEVVVVLGDVDASLAAARAGADRGLPVAHVEAGLRSGDARMPEERNRIEIDRLSSLWFVTEEAGLDNLAAEGLAGAQVHLVGDVMVDSLVRAVRAGRLRPPETVVRDLAGTYVLATAHRAHLHGDPERLRQLATTLLAVARERQVVIPLHPRTRRSLQAGGLLPRLRAGGVRMLPPVGYLDFVSLLWEAGAVLTDSGGVQTEASLCGVPCLTLRSSTEAVGTVLRGRNRLIGEESPERVAALVREATRSQATPRVLSVGGLRDGMAAERIARVLGDYLASK